MSNLKNAVTDLIVAGSTEEPDFADLQQAAQTVFEQLDQAESEELNEEIQRMLPLIEEAILPVASLVALCCGAMVENGADPLLATEPIMQRLPEAFAEATLYVEACEEAAQHAHAPSEQGESATEEDEEEDAVERFGEQIGPTMPVQANAFMALDPLGLAAIAMLSLSKESRRHYAGHEDLILAAHRLAPYHGRASFLMDMLLVLDDEPLIILHLASRRGFRVRIVGVADNFQLHTLIMGRLIGDEAAGFLPGESPEPEVVAAALDQPVDDTHSSVSGVFNLFNWPALTPEMGLPEGMDGARWWVWNEGRPADILPFEGTRVVLLGAPPYQRAWNAGRRFPNMPAEFHVEEHLSHEQVDDWLNKLAAAPPPEDEFV